MRSENTYTSNGAAERIKEIIANLRDEVDNIVFQNGHRIPVCCKSQGILETCLIKLMTDQLKFGKIMAIKSRLGLSS